MDDLALLEKARQVKTLRAQVREIRSGKWINNPVAWIRDAVPSATLADYQTDEFAKLGTNRKVAVRGPRGSGKTMPAALAFWWFASTRELAGIDWKAPTTAGSAAQVRHYLWPEIHKWHGRIRWDVLGLEPPALGKELFQTDLKMRHGQGFGRATDDPALIEGAHADHILMIIDEGKSVVDGIWDAVEGFFANPGEHYAFALSTPGAPAGRFYDIHSRKPGYEDWTPIHVTIADAIGAGRVAEDWRAQRERQWGSDSTLYRCHVLAEFAGEEDGVIPLDWVEAAIERGKLLERKCIPRRLAVDVADSGVDATAIAFRDGKDVYRLDMFTHQTDPTLAAEWAMERAVKGTEIIVDSIGVGAGTLSNLKRETGVTVKGFVAGAGTNRRDRTGEIRFANLRSAAWWNVRELLDPQYGENITLPDNDMLLGDLTSPTWREVAGGKIQVESKDDIKKRLGRSTDAGDAVIMVLWDDVSAGLEGWKPDGMERKSPWRSLS